MPEDTDSKEQFIADLGFLNETAMGFLRLGPEESLYRYIVERLASITGDSWVAITTFHPEHESICLRALTGPSDLRARVLKMIGEAPVGQLRKISEDARLHLLTGRLHKVPHGLYDVLFESVPRPVTKAVEHLAKVREFHAMGCVSQGALLGSVLIALRGSQRLHRPEVVEAFVNQAAVALQRDRAEELMRRTERDCHALIDQIGDLFVVVGADLTILDINRGGCEELGYAREDLLGKSITNVVAPDDLERSPLRWDMIRSGHPFFSLRRLRRSDGTCNLYQARVNPLPDGRFLVVASVVSETESPVRCT